MIDAWDPRQYFVNLCILIISQTYSFYTLCFEHDFIEFPKKKSALTNIDLPFMLLLQIWDVKYIIGHYQLLLFFTQKLQCFKLCYYAITDSYRLVYAWQFSKEISCNDHSNLKGKNYILPWIQHLPWNNNINDASGRSAFYSWIYYYSI